MKAFQIKTRGDNGKGCYAGVEITVCIGFVPVAVIPLFWEDFPFQALAREHDRVCDALDWKNPAQAWMEYDYATRKFIFDCLRAAAELPDTDYEALRLVTIKIERAKFLCELWGEVRFGLASAGYVF